MPDNIKIIEKIATRPDTLTKEDAQSISEKAEIKEIYQSASLMSQALADIPDFDTEKSLLMLHAKIQIRRKSFFHKISATKAAAAAGISLTALAAIAAVFFTAQDKNSITASTVEPAVECEVEKAAISTPSNGKLYYDDAPLSQILNDIGQRYNCTIQCKNPDALSSRFHLTIPGDASIEEAVKMLNAFDEIKITINDNTIIVE